MKLIFTPMNLKPHFKDIARMTFDITQCELGLTDNPTVVLFMLSERPDVFQQIMSNTVSRGSTEAGIDEDGYIRVEIAPDEIKMMMEAFCHELVHVCQDISGALKGDETVPWVEWRGKDHTKELKAAKDDFKAYEALPWEKQARNMATKIFPKVDAEFHKRWPDGIQK
jgi:hypothetical protein